MSLLLVEGFDDGLMFYKWTSVTATVSATGPRTGTNKLPVNTTNVQKQFAPADSHATMIVGAGVNFDALGASGKFMSFKSDASATQHIGLFRDNTDSSISVYFGGDSGNTLGTLLGGTGTNSVLAATWYFMEIKVVLADAGGSVEIRLNGSPTPAFSFSGDTKNAGTEAVISRVVMGTTGGNSNRTNFDDVYICNGAGSVNNNFLGDCSVRTFYPSGNGALSQLVGSDSNSVDNYLLVDEAVPSSTDYTGSATAGELDTYAFTDLASGSIKGIAHRSYVAKSEAGSNKVRQVVRVGGVNYPDADIHLGTNYVGVSRMLETNPATSAAWLLADYNSSEFGIEVRA